jgi:hypothetical protein
VRHVIQPKERFVISLGSARALACTLRRLAATESLGNDFYSSSAFLLRDFPKFALARRQHQHAGARALPR